MISFLFFSWDSFKTLFAEEAHCSVISICYDNIVGALSTDLLKPTHQLTPIRALFLIPAHYHKHQLYKVKTIHLSKAYSPHYLVLLIPSHHTFMIAVP